MCIYGLKNVHNWWCTFNCSVVDPDPRVLGLLDPNPLVRGMDPDPDWIVLTLSKNNKKTLDFSCFVTSLKIIFCVITMSQHRNYKLTSIATS